MTREAYDLKFVEVLSKCHYPDEAKEKLDLALGLLQEVEINMTQVQRLTLLSHLCAMVDRNFDGGEIPYVDKEMFSEVSDQSIDLANQICLQLPNLAEGEKYLLSIHFESARLNEV
jgi:PRD domain protein (TIGR03582 family)